MQKLKKFLPVILSVGIILGLMVSCSSTDSLMKSIEKGDTASVQKAIQDKVDVNKTDANGVYPIVKSIEIGKSEIVKMILNAGANANVVRKADGYTPLHIAIYNDNAEFSMLLAEIKASLETKTSSGETPLTIKSKSGNTLLHFAIKQNNDNLANTLLNLGAKFDVVNNANETPLMFAEQNKKYALLTKYYSTIGSIEQIIKFGELAIKENAKDTSSMYYLGVAYSNKGDSFKSESNFENSVENYEKSLAQFNKILEIKPDSKETAELKEKTEVKLAGIKDEQRKLAEEQEKARKAAEEKKAEEQRISKAKQQAKAQNQISNEQKSSNSDNSTARDSKGKIIHVSDGVAIYASIFGKFVGTVKSINGNKVQVFWYDVVDPFTGASEKNDQKSLNGASMLTGITPNSLKWHDSSKLTVTDSAY